MPSAAEVFALCDTDIDGLITFEEASACIDENIPEEDQEDAQDRLAEHWEEVAGEDGEVDIEELQAAMDLAGERDSEEEEKEERPEEPTADEIMAACDGDKDGLLSQKEARACIDEHVPEEDRAEKNKELDDHWAEVAGKDDLVDANELQAAIDLRADQGDKRPARA
jgi:Ca2+-binding EF-hand superfamily protein